jgi:hypothetical protein
VELTSRQGRRVLPEPFGAAPDDHVEVTGAIRLVTEMLDG